jgi:uncharacterized damage-inducible protein DinB
MIDHVRALARYNRWMNEKLYAIAAELSDAERKRDRGAFFKSIHGTLNHLMVGDRVWLSRFTGDEKLMEGITDLDVELYSDFAELARARKKMDDRIDAFVATLSDEKLAATFHYVRRGEAYSSPLWWCVIHMFNHQTHHRGQVTTLFMQAGRDPGATDLVAMLREEATR